MCLSFLQPKSTTAYKTSLNGELSNNGVAVSALITSTVFTNTITENGVISNALVLPVGSRVIWDNQTNAIQALTSCELGANFFYLPLIFETTLAEQATRTGTSWRKSSPIRAILAPAQTYEQEFLTEGVYDYCVSVTFDTVNTVTIVSEPPPDVNDPLISAVEGISFTQGASITFQLQFHDVGTYDIYFDDTNVITVPVDSTGAISYSWTIPPETAPGSYEIKSTVSGLTDTVVASNTIVVEHLKRDIVFVMDRSGSTEFDPICYGCWSRKPNAPDENENPRYSSYYTYPENGYWYPLGYSLDVDADGDIFEEPVIQNICNPNPDPQQAVYRDFSENPNYYYIVMDAELYSRASPSIIVEPREGGKGYWAMQRGEGNYDDNQTPYFASNGYAIDGVTPGAHMAHHPSTTASYGRHFTLEEARAGEAPVLEYDFILRNDVDNNINWVTGTDGYIWVRIHRGRGFNVDASQPQWGDSGDGRDAYWSVYPKSSSDDPADLLDANFLPPPNTVLPVVKDASFPEDMATPQDPGRWHWVRLQDTFKITPDQLYRFYFYAGSSGVSIDRIMVTNSPNSPLPTQVANGNVGPTHGSGQALVSVPTAACDPCNPIYAQNIGAVGDKNTPYDLSDCTFYQRQVPIDNRLHPQFWEWEQPQRIYKEGVKSVIEQLDPEYDQVGMVAYNNTNNPLFTELECASRRGVDCLETTNPFSYTIILRDIESIRANGGTNIGAGMKRGLELLGIDTYDPISNTNLPMGCNGGTASCARSTEAKPTLVVMTDGIPNAAPGGICRTDGPGWDGFINFDQNGTQQAYDCPLFFADQARQHGVDVIVIGIGFNIEEAYLLHLAEIAGGEFYFSADGLDLSQILGFPPSVKTLDDVMFGQRQPPIAEPFITVEESYTVTVGDPLTFQLLFHPVGAYDIYFGNILVDIVYVDGTGNRLYAWRVPQDTPPGGYEIKSTEIGQPTNVVSSNTIIVEPDP